MVAHQNHVGKSACCGNLRIQSTIFHAVMWRLRTVPMLRDCACRYCVIEVPAVFLQCMYTVRSLREQYIYQ